MPALVLLGRDMAVRSTGSYPVRLFLRKVKNCYAVFFSVSQSFYVGAFLIFTLRGSFSKVIAGGSRSTLNERSERVRVRLPHYQGGFCSLGFEHLEVLKAYELVQAVHPDLRTCAPVASSAQAGMWSLTLVILTAANTSDSHS